jgi:hypothetical protein
MGSRNSFFEPSSEMVLAQEYSLPQILLYLALKLYYLKLGSFNALEKFT